jgi:hypothetical protein
MRTPSSLLFCTPHVARLLVPVLCSVLLLAGCAEGGIGGTGGFTPDIPADPVMVSGTATKGPYVAGTSVTATSLATGNVVSSTETSNLFGEFQINIAGEGATRITIIGSWYSENFGTQVSSSTALSSIVAPEMATNINVATHLIHERVLALMNDGMELEAATSSATSELTLSLSGVLPAPSNPLDVNGLTVINARQDEPNTEGNAWLLALSALVEYSATQAGDEPGELINRLTVDLADDGVIATELLGPLLLARSRLNPDQIHSNLLQLDATLARTALDELGVAESSQYACDAAASTVVCSGLSDAAPGDTPAISQQFIELELLVANSNRFLDTDGDGEVNEDDHDDDNDGIEDSLDNSPYTNE